MLKKLIKKYEERFDALKGDEAEIDELYDDYNPSDWSGGNFDDAYELGREHGEVFKEMDMIRDFVRELEELSEEWGDCIEAFRGKY